MIVFESKPITTTFNSIPLENISLFDKNSAYVKDSTRIYNNNIYKALTDIIQTVNHIWNDTDPTDIFGFDLYTNERIPDPTNVYIENGVTVVYVLSNKHYYRAKHTGYVDYTAENPVTPTYFDDLGTSPTPLYRTELNYPDGKKNTLFWEYISGTNRNTMFDEVINKRSINNRFFQTSGTTTFSNTGTMILSSPLSDDIYEEDKIKISGTTLNDGYYKIDLISVDRLTITLDALTVSEVITRPIFLYTQTYIKWVDYGIDKVAIFNSICDSAELKVTINGNTTTYNIDMIDTSFIDTFELFCFNEPILKMKSIETIIKNFNQEFELTFFGDFQEIGEIMQGSSYYLGKAEDSISIDGKNYNPLVEADNGDIYLQDENNPINVLDGRQISIVYDSTLNGELNDKLKSLMSKRLVIAGDDGDSEDLPLLLSYCFIRDYSFNPAIKHELNKFTIQTREFL